MIKKNRIARVSIEYEGNCKDFFVDLPDNGSSYQEHTKKEFGDVLVRRIMDLVAHLDRTKAPANNSTNGPDVYKTLS